MINQSSTNNLDPKQLNNQLNDLLLEVQKVNSDIDQINEDTEMELDRMDHDIDNTLGEVKKIIANAKEIEKKALDKFDALALKQAEELAKEK